MTNSITLLFSSFLGFLQIYLILLLIRVSLTWFPNVNWYGQPFYSLSRLTDPYLRMFRGIVPPLVGIDISPILGFILTLHSGNLGYFTEIKLFLFYILKIIYSGAFNNDQVKIKKVWP